MIHELRDDARVWASGRSWLVRLPLLIFLAYAFVRYLRDPSYGSIFSAIDLMIHELGHVIFSFTGNFFGILGGTVTQLAAPVGAGIVFLRQRDYFGISVAGAWLSYNLFEIAFYVADAQEMDLPLLSVYSGEPIHDWNYLLGKLGLLQADNALAGFTRLIAFLIGAMSLALGGWLCAIMFRSKVRKLRE
jgi:hypothetical protein